MKHPVKLCLSFVFLLINAPAFAASENVINRAPFPILLTCLIIGVGILLIAALILYNKTVQIRKFMKPQKEHNDSNDFMSYIKSMNSKQLDAYRQYRERRQKKNDGIGMTGKSLLMFFAMIFLSSVSAFAQPDTATSSILGEGGIIITLFLVLIPLLGGLLILIFKVRNVVIKYQEKRRLQESDHIARVLESADGADIDELLQKRHDALNYRLSHNELTGDRVAEDPKGLLQQINSDMDLPVVSQKKKAVSRPGIDPALSKMILWYFGCAIFWLLFGTTIGEYLGIKFVSPDVDQFSWLSFGRLRPVHTNAVFWGWASLGMLGLGYYVVPRVSNTKLVGRTGGWVALILINLAVIIGSICLMAGINNGGGEYREYIWPVMLLFGVGIIITLVSYIRTIAARTTKEIYIANWYIVSAVIFAIVISIVAYVPLWQDGLGETIIQGYYMHQGVGMWFMLFTLGIVYYFLPQQLNKPIYSYSLGILAFWTQILFYTLIGTHHFVFSSIPWWLQTTAIVGSMGMVIPVVAGATNFILTFKGAWYKVPSSYTLPFFLVGIIFYFTGSLQGTAEAFRSTNLFWHFTDFTVAHSHLTMYGIICFFLWAGIYALVPRLTGKEAPQITVGAHFWLALIGLIFYTFPLMYGSTLRGIMWMEGKPFIDSVVFMAPYWLWRAIGGSLMWLSHLFFAYNFYKMLTGTNTIDVNESAIEKLNQSYTETPRKQ